MRVLTDPVETGAVTLALPQDVQAEAYDWPEELFERRVWHVRRPPAEPGVLAEAAALLRGARRPLIVAGGGTIYAEATEALRELAEATGIPVAETQAGKGSLRLRPPAGRRRDRRDRHHRRQRARPRGRRRARRRHALERLHDRLAEHLRRPRRALRQPQRRAGRRRTSSPRWRWSPTRAPGWRRCARRSRAGAPTASTAAARASSRASGTPRSRPPTPPATARSPPRARCSASSTASAARATSSSAPPAACRAICTSSGARATRRATTSSTASRAWATRSPAGSA